MTFIKDNREMVIITLVIAALFVGTCGLAYNFRGGNPSIYSAK